MASAKELLKQYWDHNSFRGEQENIINAVVAGEDVLALLPTGGGKSICYQIPSLMKEGLCLVISPLIALMKDQVENLEKKNIPALYIDSSYTYIQVSQTLQNALQGNYKFLYISPERIESNLFQEYATSLPVNFIAVDEAHCVSQWGYDFRPSYLRIAQLRKYYPHIPVIAVTASATPPVQKDIIEKLQLKNPAVFRQSFERKNLSYAVFKVESKINKLINILNNVPGTAIVYCKNRRLTKQVADLLLLQNISADHYHAGLSLNERTGKQQQWKNNSLRVMVCTNAFGMGIDKADVRSVIHYDIPDCLENYYQEAGRAGRDNQKAYAVLLYQQQDIKELQSLPDKRFPDVSIIKKVYQSIADYLQIPVGIGEFVYYDFDLLEFCKNFKYDTSLVIAVVKILEEEGYLVFNETIFLPSKIRFTADKFLLDDFEKAHPNLEPVIKCLLRTYEGIYDNVINISEKQIAKLCKIDIDQTRKDLLLLQAFGIIHYQPQKETPQILLLTNRAPANFLSINTSHLHLRKKLLQQRVDVLLKYCTQATQCRSQYIGNYFGDHSLNICGICDNCLKEKRTQNASSEFKSIEEQIDSELQAKGQLNIKEFIQPFSAVQKETFFEVLRFLQEHGKVRVSDENRILKN